MKLYRFVLGEAIMCKPALADSENSIQNLHFVFAQHSSKLLTSAAICANPLDDIVFD